MGEPRSPPRHPIRTLRHVPSANVQPRNGVSPRLTLSSNPSSLRVSGAQPAESLRSVNSHSPSRRQTINTVPNLASNQFVSRVRVLPPPPIQDGFPNNLKNRNRTEDS